MAILLFVILFVLVLFDARLLRRQNEELYFQTIRMEEWKWAVLAFLFFIIVFPFYWIKRRRFKRLLAQAAPDQELTDGDEQKKADQERTVLLSDALGVVLLYIMSMTVLGFIIKSLSYVIPGIEGGLGEVILSAGFSSGILIFLIYKVVQKYPNYSFAKFMALGKGRSSHWKMIVLPIVLGLVFSYASSAIILNREVQPSTPLSELIETTTSSFVFMVFLGMAVLFAPLCEEVIFRGYFYRVISRYKGRIFAVCFIGLLFSVLHVGQYWGDWMAIAMVSLLGFVLTWLRAWTGTTIASIVAHYIYNGGVTVIPMVMLLLANPVYFEYQAKYFNIDSEKKEELLVKSISEYPQFYEAYNDLAWLYAEEERNLELALKLINQGLEHEPSQPAFLDTKAEVLFKLLRFQEAINIEQDLVDKYTSSAYYKKQLNKFQMALDIYNSRLGDDEPRLQDDWTP